MTLDTNILIDYLNGESVAIAQINEWIQEGRALFISSISVAEVLALPTLSPTEIDRARAFLRNFISTPFNDDIAEIAALLKRKYKLKLPDIAIAATANFRHTPLVTRDRQVLKITEVIVLEI